MQTLSKLSNVQMDAIWLYSCELFEKEVKFFDLKIESEYQEREEERKIEEAKEKAKNAAKYK